MGVKTNMNKNVKTIFRFSKYIRIAHWTNATAVFMLFITALPLYTDTFKWVGSIFGGTSNAIVVHKIFAVIFLLPTLFILFTDPKGFINWTKQIISWKSYDFQFFTEFPKEFFGLKAKVPKQGFFNAGQKVNSMLTILAAVLMVTSGFLMWFPELFSKELVRWAYPVHDGAAALMIAVAIGHIYLSVGHPDSRPSLKGMTRGHVDASYAKAHHGRWYDEVTQGKNKSA